MEGPTSFESPQQPEHLPVPDEEIVSGLKEKGLEDPAFKETFDRWLNIQQEKADLLEPLPRSDGRS